MMKLSWHTCEMHCHTKNSDGEFTVLGLAKIAKERSIEGLCLTDHNTQSGWKETSKMSLPILNGIEWTTYYGHMLVIDCQKEVDWRDAVPDNIDSKIAQVKENNGLVGIAHPFQLGTPICTGGHWNFNIKNWDNVDFIEIWSEGKPFLNSSNSRAIKMWHSILDSGSHVAPTFGRDWHRAKGDSFISACTYLGMESEEVTPQKMREAIVNGRMVVSVGPLFYMRTEKGDNVGDTIDAGETVIEFIVKMDRLKKASDRSFILPKKIRLVTNNEETVVNLDVKGTKQKGKVFLRRGHWYSAELWGQENEKEHTLLAVTAPIYINN